MKLLEEQEIIESMNSISYIQYDMESNIPGVYFLIDGDHEIGHEIVYVGKSQNIQKRIRQHHTRKEIIFNMYSCIRCGDADGGFMEEMYIAKFLPRLNIDTGRKFIMPEKIFLRELRKIGFPISKSDAGTIIKKFGFEHWGKKYIIAILALRYIGVGDTDIMGILDIISE